MALRLEAAAVTVTALLSKAGVQSILLKGPTLAYLYPRERNYGDVDLLIPPEDLERARGVLASLSFAPLFDDVTRDPSKHAEAWVGQNHVAVDLHTSIAGARVEPSALWDALAPRTVDFELCSATLRALDSPSRLALIALHAAQHGVDEEGPLRDLALALERHSEEEWRQAAATAQAIGALDAFSAGLRLETDGVRVAEVLEIPAPTDPEVLLRAASLPISGAKYAALTTGSLGARLSIAWREAFPGVAYLRRSSALARRGPIGVILASALRPIVVFRRLLNARAAWRAVRTRPR